jgi:hypothetical protein
MRVVISQSMYFPWIGLLEQIRLADIFVHYDDVQYTRGFYNRVQVKTANGIKWLTVPLRDHHRGQRIDEILVDNRVDWRKRHRDILRQAYLKAPFRNQMLALVDEVFDKPLHTLADISKASLLSLARFFGLTEAVQFINSVNLGITGSGSQRILDICCALGAKIYVTGHGARNYLDHDAFEKAGIGVRYMQYRCLPYPQLHGGFTPYVTALDLVANCGAEGKYYIQSETVDWRRFLDESH